MARTHNVARSMHDVGLATWFGGSLMGAIGLNGAAAVVDDPGQRARVASSGWARWTPVNMVGIAAHLLGGLWLTKENKGRLVGQKGVGSMAIAKTSLTGLALAATAYARILGQQMMDEGEVPVESGTTPGPQTPEDIQRVQRRLELLQWAIPALTGGILVLNARMGEQQRPAEVLSDMARRLVTDPLSDVARGARHSLAEGMKTAVHQAGEVASTARERAKSIAA